MLLLSIALSHAKRSDGQNPNVVTWMFASTRFCLDTIST